MPTTVRVLQSSEAHVLSNVAPEVFDGPVHPDYTAEFFADPRHHLAVALEGDLVVGMASGIHYLHPDKAAGTVHRRGGRVAGVPGARAGAAAAGRADGATPGSLGCVAAWVLTERSNSVARRLYASVGGLEAECRIFVVPLEDGEAVSGS